MQDYSFRVFRRIFFTPDEAAQVISACEEHLLQSKVITAPFSAAEIQGEVLKQYLIDEDYTAPLKVEIALNVYTILSIRE